MPNLDKMRRMWLHVNNSPNNVLDKTKWMDIDTRTGNTIEKKKVTIVMKDNCSIENPHVIIESFNSLIRYNYCYIDDFERWYFVDDYIVLPHGAVELVLKEDYLMSFREAIKNQVVHETRATNGQSNFLVDDEVAVNTNAKIARVYSLPFNDIKNKSGVDYFLKVVNNQGATASLDATGEAIGRYAKIMGDLYSQYLADKVDYIHTKYPNGEKPDDPRTMESPNAFHYSQGEKDRSDCVIYNLTGYAKKPFPYTRMDTHKNGFVYSPTRIWTRFYDGGLLEDEILVDEKTFEVNGVTYNSNFNIIDDTYINNIGINKPTWVKEGDSWWAFDCASFAWRCCKFGYKMIPNSGAVSVDINSDNASNTDPGYTASQLAFLCNHGCRIKPNSVSELLPGDLVYWGPENSADSNHTVMHLQWIEDGHYVDDWEITSTIPAGKTLIEKITTSHVQVMCIDPGMGVGAESESQGWAAASKYGNTVTLTGSGLVERQIPDFDAYKGMNRNADNKLIIFCRPSLLVQSE